MALLNGRWVVAAFTVALIGALLGFLRFNFHPATIYLGDCGSLFVGLDPRRAGHGHGLHGGTTPSGFLAPLFILALPLIDTVYVTVLRLRAGRKIYHGSPDHFPLRLRRRLGGSTVRAVLVSYAAAVVLGALGIAGPLPRSRCRPLIVIAASVARGGPRPSWSGWRRVPHGDADGAGRDPRWRADAGWWPPSGWQRQASAVPVLERESEPGGACRSHRPATASSSTTPATCCTCATTRDARRTCGSSGCGSELEVHRAAGGGRGR